MSFTLAAFQAFFSHSVLLPALAGVLIMASCILVNHEGAVDGEREGEEVGKGTITLQRPLF